MRTLLWACAVSGLASMGVVLHAVSLDAAGTALSTSSGTGEMVSHGYLDHVVFGFGSRKETRIDFTPDDGARVSLY